MSDRSRLATLPLGPLRAFDAAARHGSFKTAAFDLAVTPAAVSHQIKALEAHLGIALFERLNRGLRLTTAGQRLAAVTEDSFARLEAGLRDLDASGLTKGVTTLTISSAPSIAAKWLVPRLHRFQAAHPQIELRLQSGDSLADVTAEGVDIALRYGTGAYGADVTETQLWPKGEIVVVCAPSLAAAGGLDEPQDVLAHPLLRTAMPARRQNAAKVAAGRTDVELGGWSSWLAAAGIEASALKPNTLRGPLFGSSHLAIDAAASGRGLALAPRILVAEDIAAGRLVEPFRIAVPDPFAYWLVHATRRAAEPRIRAFVRWVREEAAAG